MSSCENSANHDPENFCRHCSTCHDCVAEGEHDNYHNIKSLTAEVERLREALNRVLKTSRGCSGRIILEEEDELELVKALEGGDE